MKYELKSLTVDEKCELLEYLLKKYNLSKKLLKNFLSSKRVLVNGHVQTKFDYKLNIGDELVVLERVIMCKKIIPIIYEDDYLIVINKPSGLLSISNNSSELNAYNLVSNYVKTKNKRNKIFVIHRLDKETSGLLMFSKNQDLKNTFQNNWNKYALKRGYIALLEGNLSKKSGTVKSYLKETKTHYVYSSSSGKEAITNYSLIKNIGDKCLVQIFIDTGRKNQIRVHMKDINHPIVGDKKYGNGKNELCLCANILEFYHPIKKEIIKLTISIPFKI